MRSIWTPFLIVLLTNLNCFAESDSGSLCIAPARFDPKDGSAPGLYCEAEQFSLKIDKQVMAWPIKESVKLDGLDVNTSHRVIVLCNHKPQQSFTFRFSEFKTRQLCLFLNDLYRTVQLWEANGAPWCKCKELK
jgi:hypothetical protein